MRNKERTKEYHQKRFNLIFNQTSDPFYITDLEDNFIDDNKAFENIIGYSKEELTGKNFFQLGILSEEDISKYQKSIEKNKKNQSVDIQEYILQRKDTKKITVEIFTWLIEIEGNSFILAIVRDITRRKKAEEELREEKVLLTAVMDNLPIGIAINTVFPSVDFVYMNKKFPQIYRTTRKKLSKPGAFWNVAYEDPIFRKQIKKRVEDAVASGDSSRMVWKDIPLTRKGKETIYITAYNIPIPGKDLVISTVMDVTDINQSQQKLRKTMNATIKTISKISETRDPYTAGHQYRVYQLSVAIARELNLSREKIEAVRIAALIHDIGKIAIPSEILTKPGKLSEIEFDLIKEHPQTGYEILKDIDFPYPIAQIVREHHERINSSGYPNGLKAAEILLEAKIIGVADVVEAMSSYRPYRAALGVDVALAEITKNKGILYDPKIVDVCVKLFKEKGFKFE